MKLDGRSWPFSDRLVRSRPAAVRLHLCLLDYLKCIVYFDPEVADCALQFRVPE
jgi:hypothetical protein